MKHLLYLLLASTMLFTACEEITPPGLDLENELGSGGNNNNSDTVRRVMIEEFTGVKCVNCPGGSAEIENLLAQHGDKLVAVSIHTGFFSQVYPQSTQNLTVAEGTAINATYGPVTGYPAAIVNRKAFNGQSARPLILSDWGPRIADELAESAKVRVDFDHTWNAGTRNLDVTVDVEEITNAGSNLVLTVYVTEDSIVSAQLTPAGINDNYVHKHVLRVVLPNTQGEPLASLPSTKSFSTTLPALWRAEKCHIIAFVSRNDPANNNYEVLQVKQEHLVE
jgi:hypothetical protein